MKKHAQEVFDIDLGEDDVNFDIDKRIDMTVGPEGFDTEFETEVFDPEGFSVSRGDIADADDSDLGVGLDDDLDEPEVIELSESSDFDLSDLISALGDPESYTLSKGKYLDAEWHVCDDIYIRANASEGYVTLYVDDVDTKVSLEKSDLPNPVDACLDVLSADFDDSDPRAEGNFAECAHELASKLEMASPVELDDDLGDIELSTMDDGEFDVDFTVPLIPGADFDGPDVSYIDDEPEEVVVVSADPWDWKSRGMENFIMWLHEMINGVPRHSGKDTTGVERALAHFENLDRAITQAMRTDFKGEIDAAKAEKAREQIQDGMKRLIERLETLKSKKFKKKASIVKEARHEKIVGITVTVPLLISRIARTLVNGTVSAGHNMERMFEKLAAEYELTKRERAEVAQLLEDMGYLYQGQLDRGYPIGDAGVRGSSDNYDLASMYPG